MSPATQSLLVFATVALAAAYLLVRAWRKHRRARTGCGSGDEGCGCTQLRKTLRR
jgi:hypothetical protein